MSDDIALDFGTSRTRVADAKGVLLFDEPTIAAVDDDTGRLIAFGDEALEIGTASAGRVVITRPVRRGQLVDLVLAEDALAATLGRIGASRLSRPRVLVGVHVNETNVQCRALERALRKAGARQVLFVEQPLACAIGADMAIEEPEGAMAIDIGAGTTDIAIMALGGVVTSASLEVGGDTFDEAIRNFLARRYDLVIGWDVAEQLKRTVGSLDLEEGDWAVEVTGRLNATGEVADVTVKASELLPVLEEIARPILDAAARCIGSAPPDLANDLLGRGLVLGGAGGHLGGFEDQLGRATGVAVHKDERGGALAVTGASRCLRRLDLLASVSRSVRR